MSFFVAYGNVSAPDYSYHGKGHYAFTKLLIDSKTGVVYFDGKGPSPKHCPKYDCDSKLASCGVMTSNEKGKSSMLNTCSNSTGFQCLFTETLVNANEFLDVKCTEKPTETRIR